MYPLAAPTAKARAEAALAPRPARDNSVNVASDRIVFVTPTRPKRRKLLVSGMHGTGRAVTPSILRTPRERRPRIRLRFRCACGRQPPTTKPWAARDRRLKRPVRRQSLLTASLSLSLASPTLSLT